jgi:rod shape-determining protein MreC
MPKYIFISIIIIGLVFFFLPPSIKLPITKYPRIALLFPLEGINKFSANVSFHKKEYRYFQELATRLTVENAQLRDNVRKDAEKPLLTNATLISARIIARDNETGVQYLTIDKSANDNLAINMPVLTAQGVIGKIIETNQTQSIIETALSPGLKMSAVNLRSQVVGIVEYSNLSNLRFKYAFAESDIQPDDTIVTSGLGGIFPRGLRIGTIIKNEPDPTRYFQYVEVKPTVNLNTLDEIFILTNKLTNYQEIIPDPNILENLKVEAPPTPRTR